MEIQEVTSDPHILVGLMIALALIAGVLIGQRFKGKTQMTAPQREQEVASAMADMVYTGLSHMQMMKEISPAERKDWEKRFAWINNLRDLLPKGQKTLKERLAAKHKKEPEQVAEVVAAKPIFGGNFFDRKAKA